MYSEYLIKAFSPIFVGGLILFVVFRIIFVPNMIEQPIKYCVAGHGVKTTISGFANLSHRYVCNNDTTEDDRGETEMIPDPKSTPWFNLP